MMNVSTPTDVRDFYDKSAESYAAIMDAEIDLPVYADVLGRLAKRIVPITGAVVDTSCGPGHMLRRYNEDFDSQRSLIGIDLSPRMVTLATSRLGARADVMCGDMRDSPNIRSDAAAAILSFFAIHHLDSKDCATAMREWHRILGEEGQLVIAAWEGDGPIDYGGACDVVALRYTKVQLVDLVQKGGFLVNRCVVEPVDEMPMDAVYLEATKAS